MANTYADLRAAIGIRPTGIQVVEIVAHEGTSQSRVQFDDNSQRIVYGQSVEIGDKAYLQDEQILGEAPDATLVEVEV